ncbi:unnamed protein product (macronuclear) [Paramecium tetraurelia]|uniref:RAP domain-containing protein n=1 Tax=Paramecium tetraurelia TaxID=5888 RepID=A0D089_PARTE|nr:uncharacterized protein GSPATT00012008001 [Paramecium tetraurelia]CAK76456.1 unnamed protein product [Paramecium tetraurelia]|eukprot:XP_001443853.1 hypothetical protein (macronuclear) [Paramecium tetraurelia strain d4-2]
MNRVITFGFATYESLVQKLNSVENASSLFRLYEENKESFKHEHVVLSLRVLGRFSRQIQSDNNISEITSKLNDMVGQLSEYDVVDVLFWLRKFRSNRIPTNITNQTQNQLFQRVQQMTDNQMFSFRNMCNIYFDLSTLNHYNETLVKSISEQMLKSKQLSPFLITQLLSTVTIKINHCNLSKYDQVILTNSIKLLDDLLDSFDIEQKSLLFKVCAEVQFQNLPPKFYLPIQVKKIKDQLLEKAVQLPEESVINIFRAYDYLPRQFEVDLLRELKDKILTTLELNPSNLSNRFLIQIAERMIKMTNQRIPQDAIKKVLIEVCSRISNKTIDASSMSSLIMALMEYKKVDEVLKTLQNVEDKNIKVLNYLFINGINLKEHVDKFMQNYESKKIPFNLAVYYTVYANRDAKEHLLTLITVIREQIENYPLQALKTLKDNELNFEIKYQLQEEAYMKLVECVQTQKFDFLRVCSELINCCCNAKCREALINLYDEIFYLVNIRQIMQRLVQEGDSFDSESLSVLIYIFQKDPKSIPIQKFVDYLTLNSHKLRELIKSDQIQNVTKLLVSAYYTQPEQKQYSIVNFANRFEIAGYHSKFVTAAIRKISEQFKRNNPYSPFPDPMFVYLLIDHNILNPEEAAIQLNNENFHHQMKVQLCGIALSAERAPQNVQELGDKIKEDCFKALEKEVKYQTVLELITLGNLSPQELLSICTTLQTLLPYLSTKQYFDLIMFAKDHFILRELSLYFGEFSRKLGINRIIRVADKFARFQIYSRSAFNVLLETYGYSFYSVYNEQRIQILEIFSLAKIKQADLFKRTLELIKQRPSAYKNFYFEIIDSANILGFVESEFVDLINSIIDKTQLSRVTALKLMQYYVLADQPIEEIEKIAENIVEPKYRDSFKSAMVYELMLRKYPNSPATRLNENFLSDEIFSKARFQIAYANQIPSFQFQYCVQFLNLLGIQFESNKRIDGINVQLYLPSIESSLFIASQSSLCFDYQELNGFGLLQVKLMQTLTKQVIVLNFKQFILFQSDEERITYLKDLGLPITVDLATVDYSTLELHCNIEQDRLPHQLSKQHQRRQFGVQNYLQDFQQLDKE